MTKFNHITILLLTLLFIVSCSTSKKLTRNTKTDTTEVTDSVRTQIIRERVVEEVIKTVPDSSSMKALAECNEQGEVLIKEILDYRSGKSVKTVVKVVDNIIEVDCIVDSLEVYRILKEQEMEETSSNETKVDKKVEEKEKVKETKKSWTFNITAYITLLLLGAVLGILLQRYLLNKNRK